MPARAADYGARMLEAVLWDFGGVILSSPFEAFNRYEERAGLPLDFLRRVNSTNPHENAWARLERNEIGPAAFDAAFAEDSTALGHTVRGADVLALLAGEIRPEMVHALDAVKAAGYKTACLTNNILGGDGEGTAFATVEAQDRADRIAQIMGRFDAIIESSKVGVRKPEPRFYEIACDTLGVEPSACVFLDDLGINLKPAAAMGMRTIKVVDAAQALAELSEILGIPL
jgi:putative hydrolase of the HAD superfamily